MNVVFGFFCVRNDRRIVTYDLQNQRNLLFADFV